LDVERALAPVDHNIDIFRAHA